jgi:outer membrane protein assembly factor BamD
MEKMKKRIIWLCFYLSVMGCVPLLKAEVILDRDKGVRVEGGFLSRFFGKSSPSREQAQLLIEKAEAALSKRNFRSALSTYKKIAKRFSIEKVTTKEGKEVYAVAEALYQSALLRERNSQWEHAFNALQEVVEKYPSYDFEKVINAQSRIASKLGAGARTKIFWVIPGFRNYDKAMKFHKQISENARGPEHAPAALMASAEIARSGKKESEAIDVLEQLINFYPEDILCEKAYFDLAEIYESMVKGPLYDQGATLKSINYYEDFRILFSEIEKSPRETEVEFEHRRASWQVRVQQAEKGLARMRDMLARSKLEIGQFYHRHGQKFSPRGSVAAPAKQYYQEAITLAPNSESARTAQELLEELQKTQDQSQP